MIDKKNLIKQLIALIDNDINNQRKAFEIARQTTIDVPGRMQSRYDTMAIESAWVADGLAKALNEKEMSKARLLTLKLDESFKNNVRIGSIVEISSSDTSKLEYFFILPVASGYSLIEKDKKMTTLTPTTPLGKVLIGKEVGDEIEVNFPTKRLICIEKLF